jgi:glutathione S-transferase
MSEVIIHGVDGSPFVRSVQLVLEEKGGQPYRIRPMAPGESKSEAYLKMQPFGRLPVVEHDGFQVYETQAAARYLDAVLPGPALQPADPRRAARMNQVIGINDCYLFPQVARVIVFQRIVGPAFMQLTPDEAACAAAVPDATTCFGALESLLGDQPFFAGETLSLADLMIAPQLAYLAMTPEGAHFAGTRLAAWLERMQARPSMQATQPPVFLRQAA